MLHQFDHRYATYDGATQANLNVGILPSLSLEQKQNPALVLRPNYWVAEANVHAALRSRWNRKWLIASRWITKATNERTYLSTVVPLSAIGNSAPVLLLDGSTVSFAICLVGCLASFALDYVARQELGGNNMTFGTTQQLPVLPPSKYAEPCPWDGSDSLLSTPYSHYDWLLPRVLELTYTAWDLEPFARDCGYAGPPFRWDEARRFLLRAELDAAFFHLYGLNRDDTAYILDTFPIVRRKDEAKYNGEYKTKTTILEIYDALAESTRTGQPYQTRLDPPPADPRVAHPPKGSSS